MRKIVLLLYIDGKKITFSEICRDKYKCSMEFMVKSDANSWYFEVYDRDFGHPSPPTRHFKRII